MAYICPFATRLIQHRYILCKALMKESLDYTQIINASKAFCAYQYLCRISGKTENTDRARQCYECRVKEVNKTSSR